MAIDSASQWIAVSFSLANSGGLTQTRRLRAAAAIPAGVAENEERIL
ncbi:MAG: hypothetical protein ACXVFQ_24885 [Solirubrobacteraceae bacterium]